ncbi:MAG: hypothetical protein LKF96_10900 [Treponema sp.]|jgi:hypothetical protein|nr:hypothetical protein [Treponema sp.]
MFQNQSIPETKHGLFCRTDNCEDGCAQVVKKARITCKQFAHHLRAFLFQVARKSLSSYAESVFRQRVSLNDGNTAAVAARLHSAPAVFYGASMV